MAKVIWTDQALADIDNIVAYVFNQSRPLAAQRLGQRLLAAGESLADNPERGRTSTRGRREIVAVPPYALRYRVVGDRVVIGSIRHSARRPI